MVKPQVGEPGVFGWFMVMRLLPIRVSIAQQGAPGL